MFGYTRPVSSDLLPEEEAVYKQYYCGVCRELQAVGRFRHRMLLSYDLSFYALFFSALDKREGELVPAGCPLPKIDRPQARITPFVTFAAALTLLLAEEKFSDDKTDGDTVRGAIGDWFLGRDLANVKATCPEAARRIAAYPTDTPAPEVPVRFGALLKDLFALGAAKVELSEDNPLCEILALGHDPVSEAAARIGEALGEWLVWLDALDDENADRKKGRDNPLFHLDGDALAALPKKILSLEDVMRRHAALLTYERHGGIVRSLFVDALPAARARTFRDSRESSVIMKPIWTQTEAPHDPS